METVSAGNCGMSVRLWYLFLISSFAFFSQEEQNTAQTIFPFLFVQAFLLIPNYFLPSSLAAAAASSRRPLISDHDRREKRESEEKKTQGGLR